MVMLEESNDGLNKLEFDDDKNIVVVTIDDDDVDHEGWNMMVAVVAMLTTQLGG